MSNTSKYEIIYEQMEFDKWYTAAELKVAPASMTAMVNRGMVEKTDTSPRKYRKIKNVLSEISNLLSKYPNIEYFTLYKKASGDKTPLGMMCSYDSKNSKILDCWGKTYDMAGVDRIQIGQNFFQL